MTIKKLSKLSLEEALVMFEEVYGKVDDSDQAKWKEGFNYAVELLNEPKEEKEKKPKTMFKYECKCEGFVKAKSDKNIKCVDCGNEFVMEEEE